MQLKVGTDFAGIGSVEQALSLLGVDHETVFACDWDKFSRKAFSANYGRPKQFPKDVHEREIPIEPLDLYVTTPPCQAFSMAGKRKGEDDKRGILFYNSHHFIQENKPRFFIFENVKGLLSHDRDKNDKSLIHGKTFKKWIQHLGGKSVNGQPVLFPYEDAVPYHIYWKVLNAKEFNVPQNRERVFIVGIRDEIDNHFTWPKEEPLTVAINDLLETEVPKKYFLGQKVFDQIMKKKTFDPGSELQFHIHSATKKGFEVATLNDSINYSVMSSKTRRGRVGKGVAQTLDTGCHQGVILYLPGRMVGRNPDNPSQRTRGGYVEQTAEFNEDLRLSNTLSTVAKDNILISDFKIRRYTPRECLRIMGFPDTFEIVCSDAQTYKQAGNSIVVPKMAAVIRNLLKL